MEFKDLATKFEGLTADQVGVLAEFGKNILDDAGIFGLPSYLLGLIQDIDRKSTRLNSSHAT